MSIVTPSLLNWQPVPRPARATLHGRYVTLEPLECLRHAEPLWQAVQAADDALWAWMPDGPYASRESFEQTLAGKENSTDAVFFAIVPAATGRAAGYAGYMRIEPAHGVVEVGNVLMTPGLQRTTAATEAMYLMARHVFEDLGYRRYEWKCNALNLSSRRAAERLGFTFEGVFRQHMVVKGCNRDTAWFSMVDNEWPARKQAFEAWLDPQNFDEHGRQRKPLSEFGSQPGAFDEE